MLKSTWSTEATEKTQKEKTMAFSLKTDCDHDQNNIIFV